MTDEIANNGMHRVRAKRQRDGWVLRIAAGPDEVWVRRLTEAVAAARSLISAESGTPAGEINVQIDIDLGEPLQSRKREAVQAILDARRAQEKASQAYREVARKLQDSGVSGAEIALILNVSRQRVSQLLSEE
jgi:DNA-directed RNA polymerase specialized sigma24 family protein